MTPPPHLVGVLRSLWAWRRPILYVTAAGALLSILIALLLPAYYTSGTTFLTLSPDQASIDGVFGNNSGRMQFYGNGDDIDRTMAVAESDVLIDYMIDQFDLYEVYAIDTTHQKAPLYVRRAFLDNYEVIKNARDGLELTVQDRDPARAAAMATAATQRINDISLALLRATQQRSAAGLRREISTTEETLVEINQRVQAMRARAGVYNTDAQSEALAVRTSGLAADLAATKAKLAAYRAAGGRSARDSIAKYRVVLAGLEGTRATLDSQLYRLNEYLGPIDNLEEERMRLNTALSYNRIRLKQYETVLQSDQRAIEVVEAAKVPVARSYPVRSLIVIGATLFSFLVAVVGVLFLDTSRRYDWSGIFTTTPSPKA